MVAGPCLTSDQLARINPEGKRRCAPCIKLKLRVGAELWYGGAVVRAWWVLVAAIRAWGMGLELGIGLPLHVPHSCFPTLLIDVKQLGWIGVRASYDGTTSSCMSALLDWLNRGSDRQAEKPHSPPFPGN